MSDARIATLQKTLEKIPVTARVTPDSPFTYEDLSKFRDGECIFARDATELIKPVTAFMQSVTKTNNIQTPIYNTRSGLVLDLSNFLDESDEILPTTSAEIIAPLIERGNSLQARLTTILNESKNQKPFEIPLLPTEAELLKLYTTHALENKTENQITVQAETLKTKNTYLDSIQTANLHKKRIQEIESKSNKLLNSLKENEADLIEALTNLNRIAAHQKLAKPLPASIPAPKSATSAGPAPSAPSAGSAPSAAAAPGSGPLTSCQSTAFPVPPKQPPTPSAPPSPEQLQPKRSPGIKIGA